MMIETREIPVKKIVGNKGQIKGLPKNPRLIKDEKYRKLVNSIQEDPEMMELREIIVIPHDDYYIAICGNMRLQAMNELKIEMAPCKILPEDTPLQKLKAYTIKDNVGFGEHDWELLANEWDSVELEEWGLDVPNWSAGIDENNMTDNDVDIDDEFDPIGSATDLHKVVFIFDNESDAGEYFQERIPDIKYKKFGGQNKMWQVNLSKNYGKNE